MLNQQSKFMSGFNGIAPTASIGHNGKKMYAAKPAKLTEPEVSAYPKSTSEWRETLALKGQARRQPKINM